MLLPCDLQHFLLVIFLLVFNLSYAQRPGNPIPAFESYTVHNDNKVTLRYYSANAKEVKVSTQMVAGVQTMIKGDSGLWSVTLGPVKPDMYPYNFIVDGTSVADPRNTAIFSNEGFQSSIIEITGSTPLVHTNQDVPHRNVSYHYYKSPSLGIRPVVVYTPPGYTNSSKSSFPVLYLLHGTTDTEETWTKVGRANIILDNLIAQGKAKPMIIVMPYGRAYPKISKAAGSIRNWDNLQLIQKDFLENLFPFVESNYRIKPGKENRAVAGFSGGGGTSLYVGLNNPDIFSWVCGFAPGMLKDEYERNNAVPFADPALTNKRLKLFWIGVGKEDGLYPIVTDYLKLLDDKKITHDTFISDGGHTWMNCKLYLSVIAQKLFQ